METQLQELLDTITRDGVRAAEQKAEGIVAEAQREADALLKAAREEETRMRESAEKRIAQWQRSAEVQLRHAAENLIIGVRERVVALFSELLYRTVDDNISATQYAEIIVHVVTDQIIDSRRARTVELSGSQEELAQISAHLHAQLQKELRKQITLTPLSNSNRQITLMFDEEHSGYSLSIESVTETMQELLAPHLRKLLDGMLASPQKKGADTRTQ